MFEFESENLESVVLPSYFSVPSTISSRDSPELQLREAACLVRKSLAMSRMLEATASILIQGWKEL